MKLRRLVPAACLGALLASVIPLQALAAQAGAASARVIVKYRADSTMVQAQAASAPPRPQHADTLSRRLGLALVDGRVLGARTQGLKGSGVDSETLAQRLAAQPDVEWAVVDRRRTIAGTTPNDPYFAGGQTAITPAVGQWYLRAPAGTVKAAIDAIGAWSLTWGSSSITVAVIDTGVRYDHPDLRYKLWPGYDFIAEGDTAADGSGRDGDASDPGDHSSSGDSCGAGDSSWHGTQVSGLIAAATDNGIGMAGSGRNVMVLPVRALGKCGGYDSDIIAGMRWAAGLSTDPTRNPHPARVLNLSLGGAGACDASYRDVVNELATAGVVVVAAAGNEEGSAVIVPANCPGVIGVAGVRHVGTKVGYSNVGPELAIAAPAGNCVNTSGSCLYPLLTTTNAGTTTPAANTYSNSSRYSVGTSFATPLVAGTVAMMLSLDPTLTPSALRSKIRSTARPFPTTGGSAGTPQCHAPDGRAQDECYCTTSTCGAGLLNAAAAVASALPAAGAPPLVAATTSSTSPASGDQLTLSAAATASSGNQVASYRWSVASGSASIVGSADGETVTFGTSSAGDVIAQVTVTDTAGAVTAQTVGFTVQAPPGSGGAGGGSGGEDSGGGGGAFGPAWLALLALAALLSGRARTPRRSPAA